MSKLAGNWRQKSLEVLENHNWGESANAPTNLVKRCIELTKIPVDKFTLSDMRIMIGQNFGLQYLIPLAIERLQENIFIDTEFYEGDLLQSVLKIDTSFWKNHENYWMQLNEHIKNRRQELMEKGIVSTNFDNTKII